MTNSDEPSFDADWLRQLIEDRHVLKDGGWKRFSAEALHCMSSSIRVRAFRHKTPLTIADELAPLRNEAARMAFEPLLDCLRERREFYARKARAYELDREQPHGRDMARAPWDSVLRIDHALWSLGLVAPLLTPLSTPEPPTTWRDHAVDLAREFVLWHRIIQPDKPMGISEGGPVATYVAAVVPFITGEAPSVGAVARFLKENKELINSRDAAA
jgi:hypothetical protein